MSAHQQYTQTWAIIVIKFGCLWHFANFQSHINHSFTYIILLYHYEGIICPGKREHILFHSLWAQFFSIFKYLDTEYVGHYYFTLALDPSSDRGISGFQKYREKDGEAKKVEMLRIKKIMKLWSHWQEKGSWIGQLDPSVVS